MKCVAFATVVPLKFKVAEVRDVLIEELPTLIAEAFATTFAPTATVVEFTTEMPAVNVPTVMLAEDVEFVTLKMDEFEIELMLELPAKYEPVAGMSTLLAYR